MIPLKVSYTKEQHARAKAGKLHLVTLDITGKHAGRGGATYSGYLFTRDEVAKVWRFVEWLCTRGKKTKPKR